MTATIVSDKDRFLELIDQAPPHGNFQALRGAARDRFRALPFPTTRAEDWRFTSIASLLRVPFESPDASPAAATRLPEAIATDAIRLVFVNGFFQQGLSRLDGCPAGVRIGPLTEEHEDKIGHFADYHNHIFTALNTAMLQDGAAIVVPDGMVLSQPVEIVYATSHDRPVLTQPRTLIVVGKNSQATVVERFVTLGEGPRFTNAVAEIVLGEHAVVDHYKLQDESRETFHIANTQIALAGRSNFTTHYVALGGSLVRNEVRVRFDGSHAEATVNGVYLAEGRQHLDNLTEIDHAQPHCASHELYKGILDGQAHGVFSGKILVRPDAQKTDAKQTNKVLLLSDDATINTKPQLEIFADDVKCTHGATVGQLDADMIFYLRARGIDLESARSLLTFAFANDIVRRIKIEALREQLEDRIVRS